MQWVPGHAGVEGNERADQVAKQAANKTPGRGPREISLAFACRARTEAITTQKQRWLTKELSQRSQQGQLIYRPQKNWRLNPTAADAPKHLASQYFQLKSEHQPLEYIYIRSRPKRMQPAEIVAYQGKQHTVFSLNAGNGDTNEASSTGIWSWMGL